MNQSIFKSYDIRGLYPDDFNEEAVRTITQAFVARLRPRRIALGRDARLSSPKVHRVFVETAAKLGVEIDDLGLVPSEVVYFAVGKYGYDAGAMITASHNPAEYNGIRFVDHEVKMIPGRDLLPFLHSESPLPETALSRIQTREIIPDYLEHVLSFIDVKSLRPLRVVVDAGNGMAGIAIPQLAQHLPITIFPLFFELNGRFPNRSPNPVLPEAREKCCRKVVEEKADLGVVFDGDGDRTMFITEQGKWVRGDIGLLLLAKHFLKKYPGKGVSYNVVCSRIVPEKVRAWGGRPLRTPVGFVNVSGALREHDGILGGETSAHYCFRDNFYADSGLIAFVVVLQMLSEVEQPLSELVADLNPYYRTEEYFTVSDQQSITRVIEKQNANGKKDTLDGLTVEYDDWWFNVRPSNTEPLLRLTIEANNEKLLKEKLDHLRSYF